MTLKNLFFKRMKQDLEQRIWLPVLFFIIGFLAMEITLISRIDLWQDRSNYAVRMKEYLMNSFFSPNSGFTILTIVVAVVSAMSGFVYMHSAKKLDVYHSIPIKRERLFLQQYVYGILYYVVPLVLHVLICFGMCATNGLGGAQILGQAAGFLLVQILIYLACYAVTCTAVALTGNLVISVLGCCVLSAYSLILGALKQLLMDRFYMTFYSTTEILDFPAFSPVHLVLKLVDNMNLSDSEYHNYTGHMWDYGKLLLMAVIYTVIAIFLYKRRPTEAAGRTMAFPVTEPIVKTMVVFPASIVCGYLFAGILSNSDNMGWFVFGCIFGFAIICPLMEIIFRKDVKAVLAHPGQLVFNGACVIVTLIVLQFDLTGYDTYIPKEEKVESYAVYLGGMPYIYSSYGSSIDWQLETMAITDNPGAWKLVEHGAQITRSVRKDDMTYSELEHDYSDMTVRYNLKNGKTVYRSYLLDISEAQVLQWLGELTDSMEYKLAAYPILTEGLERNYVGIMVDTAYDAATFRLTEEQVKQFVEIYQRELTNMTFADMLEEFAVAELTFLGGDPQDGDLYIRKESVTYAPSSYQALDFEYYSEDSGYRIYPSFTQTLALLEEYGMNPESPITAENVSFISIVDDSLEADDKNGLYDKQVVLAYRTELTVQEQIDEMGVEDMEVTPISQEQIRQILANVIPGVLSGNRYHPDRIERYTDVQITYEVDGRREYVSCYFPKGSIPEFLKKDIEEAKAKLGE